MVIFPIKHSDRVQSLAPAYSHKSKWNLCLLISKESLYGKKLDEQMSDNFESSVHISCVDICKQVELILAGEYQGR